MKPKVCFVVYRENYNLTEGVYAKYLFENGIDVTIIAPTVRYEKDYINSNGIKITNILLNKNSKRKQNIFYFLRQASECITNSKFNIVHIFSSCHFFFLFKFFIKQRVSLIYHLLSYPLSKNFFKQEKSKILIFFQSLFMDKIIIQSAELMKNMLGLSYLNKSIVMLPGFDKELFSPQKQYSKKLNSSPKIVYCGAIDKLRGLETLIMSYVDVLKQHPKVIFWVIGKGNALSDLEKMVKDLQIEKSVLFLGHIPHNQLHDYFTVADIAISYVPVIKMYDYNPPRKTYEYLGSGLATIATKTVSNMKIIKHLENGILVDDTPESITGGIKLLLKDEKLLYHIRSKASKSVMPYGSDIIVREQLIPIYQNLI